MLENIYKIIGQTPIDKNMLIDLVPEFKQLDELKFVHPAHSYGVLDHSIKAAETLDDLFLRLVMLFHDIGKLTTAYEVPNKFNQFETITKFPNHELESVRITKNILENNLDSKLLSLLLSLIEYHDTPLMIDNDYSIMEKLVKLYGTRFVSMLLKVQRADMSMHSKEYYEKCIKPRLDYICDFFTKKFIKEKV